MKKNKLLFLKFFCFLLFFLIFATIFNKISWACSWDIDCPVGQTCVSGNCEDYDSGDDPLETWEKCPGTHLCSDVNYSVPYECTPSCSDPSGGCRDLEDCPTYVSGCSTDADCFPNNPYCPGLCSETYCNSGSCESRCITCPDGELPPPPPPPEECFIGGCKQGSGLWASYYEAQGFYAGGGAPGYPFALPAILRNQKLIPQINFDWGTSKPTSCLPSSDHFAILFTGFLYIPRAGTYTFIYGSDDASRLLINGSDVCINSDGNSCNWYEHSYQEVSGQRYFASPAWVPIRFEYYEGGWDASVKLEWSSNTGINRQVIPYTSFRSCSQPPPPTCSIDIISPSSVAEGVAVSVSANIIGNSSGALGGNLWLMKTNNTPISPLPTPYFDTYLNYVRIQLCTSSNNIPCYIPAPDGNKINLFAPAGSYTLFCDINNTCSGLPGYTTPCSTDVNNPDHRTFTVTPPGPWFQTQGGDVHAGGTIKSIIPAAVPAASKYFSLGPLPLTLLSHPGVISYGGTLAPSPFGAGSPSTKNWLANSNYDLSKYSYDYFWNKLKDKLTDTTNGDSPPNETGIYYIGDNLNLDVNNKIDIDSDHKLVVFVNGNLNISKEIKVENGSSLVFIVSGNINIQGTVGDKLPSTTPHIEGIYLAYQKPDGSGGIINTNEPNDSSGNRLVGAGVFFAEAGFSLSRSLKNAGSITDSTTPAEQFIFRPDLVLNSPRELWVGTTSWQETAP